MLNAGGLLKAASTHERAVRRIERIGLIAAAMQRLRQAALDPARRDSGDEIGKTPVGARREAGEHVVFSVPARATRPFGDELAVLAVKRAEVGAIVRRHMNAGRLANVEGRLVM